MIAERAVTIGTGFGTAFAEGAIARKWPLAGLIIAALGAIGGTTAGLLTKGLPGAALAGAGAGSLGAFGFHLPYVIWPVEKIGGGIKEAAKPLEIAAGTAAARTREAIKLAVGEGLE